MYNFIDVNEVSESILPSEALQINGEFIENLIEGYRTLSVSGRESLSAELATYESGVRDGSMLLNKRYPERIIVVKFQLVAKTNEDFREAFNKLGGILNVKEAELIFNDELDKFYIGTPYAMGDIEPGKNAVVGEFEILCTDPFKYSVVEYEAEKSLDESSILIDYHGTYKAFPILEADFFNESEVLDDGETESALTGNGDCGYVAFFNENEKIIQLGDPNEEDGVTAYKKSQTLANQTFLSNKSWGTTAKSLWSVNKGDILPSTSQQIGSVGMAVANYTTPSAPKDTSGTLLYIVSQSSLPRINYTVSARASNRTETSVRVDLAITAALELDSNCFGRGYGLVVSVYIGGAWHSATMKNTTDYWRGRTGHTVNLSVTITELTKDTTAISTIRFKAERTDNLGQSGVVGVTGCNNLGISKYEVPEAASYYLHANAYGTSSGKYHGAAITRTLKADASGEVGAEDFTFTYKQKLCIGSKSADTKQLGAFQVQLSTSTGANVAGVRIRKNRSGKNGILVIYMNGKEKYSEAIDLSYNNKYFSEKGVKNSTIIKTGGKVSFNIGGFKKTFTDDALDGIKVSKITFMFEKWSNVEAIEYNGIYSAKFVKNNCETWKDIPNKFSANDILEADCKSGEVYLNGSLSPEYGALGNDWEEFYLTPGLNQIGFSYSDWVSKEWAPNIKVRYREVYL